MKYSVAVTVFSYEIINVESFSLLTNTFEISIESINIRNAFS